MVRYLTPKKPVNSRPKTNYYTDMDDVEQRQMKRALEKTQYFKKLSNYVKQSLSNRNKIDQTFSAASISSKLRNKKVSLAPVKFISGEKDD
jgi:hypothetical protein